MTDGTKDGPSNGQEPVVDLPESLRTLAQRYHEPPPPPREEMWARIQEARSTRHRSSDRPAVLPFDRPAARPPARWLRFAAGIAALLALGVAIGRWTIPAGPDAGPAPGPATMAAVKPRSDAAYSVAASNHLSRTEAFLTALRVGDRSALLDGQARDLLLTTRLLLDAPGVTDPRTRALLEDLELVLVQITQLGTRDGEELDLINDGLEQRKVLPRLRLAVLPGA